MDFFLSFFLFWGRGGRAHQCLEEKEKEKMEEEGGEERKKEEEEEEAAFDKT